MNEPTPPPWMVAEQAAQRALADARRATRDVIEGNTPFHVDPNAKAPEPSDEGEGVIVWWES